MKKQATVTLMLRKQALQIPVEIATKAVHLATALKVLSLAGTGVGLGWGAAQLTSPRQTDIDNAQKEYEAASTKTNVDKLYARLAKERQQTALTEQNKPKPARVLV